MHHCSMVELAAYVKTDSYDKVSFMILLKGLGEV